MALRSAAPKFRAVRLRGSTVQHKPHRAPISFRTTGLTLPHPDKSGRLLRKSLHTSSIMSSSQPERDNKEFARGIVGWPKGHKYWGFIIYRSTCVEDAAWSTFTALLHADAADMINEYEIPEAAESLSLYVRDDAVLFDGASKDKIYEYFTQWISSPQTAEEETTSEPDGEPILRSDQHGT